MAWKYDKGESGRRAKHAWDRDHAGFELVDGRPVWKCPRGISTEEAEAALNQGLEWHAPRSGVPWPQRIYIIRDGVLYRAMPTNPGTSYHAFPETGTEFRRLPAWLRQEIMARARQLDCEDQLSDWLKRT
ncbi:MAG TPA: hypothetical protein VND93_09635 [Myxococcales bacterium]|nr:hypothetical protein [Myxococcales bacterium]